MTLDVLFTGFFVFFICLAVHVVVWRIRRPGNRPMALFIIFIILAPMVTGIIGYFLPGIVDGVDSLAGWAAVALLHLGLSFSYILTYPAIEAVSPSLVITLMLADSGPEGLAKNELSGIFEDEVVLSPRLKDIEEAGFAVESSGTYTLTPRGAAITRFFITLRKVLGLPTGAG